MSVREGADSTMGLRDCDGMSDATEGVVSAIAATGGNDEVVFAAWNRIAKDDFSSDDVAFKDSRLLDDLCGGRGVEGTG